MCPRHLWLTTPVRQPAGERAKRACSRVPKRRQCSACERQQRGRTTLMMTSQKHTLNLKQWAAKMREHGWAMRSAMMEKLARRSCRCRPSEWWCLQLWYPCRRPSGGVSTGANLELSGACVSAVPLASRTESFQRSFSAVQWCVCCRRTTGGSDHTPHRLQTFRGPRPIESAVEHCEMNQKSERASRDWLK